MSLVSALRSLVINVGQVAGSEVAQLYVELPRNASTIVPLVQLQGFRKQFLTAGESRGVSFKLVPRQLSVAQSDGTWLRARGTATISVGGHMPLDKRAEQSSNVVSVKIEL